MNLDRDTTYGELLESIKAHDHQWNEPVREGNRGDDGTRPLYLVCPRAPDPDAADWVNAGVVRACLDLMGFRVGTPIRAFESHSAAEEWASEHASVCEFCMWHGTFIHTVPLGDDREPAINWDSVEGPPP